MRDKIVAIMEAVSDGSRFYWVAEGEYHLGLNIDAVVDNIIKVVEPELQHLRRMAAHFKEWFPASYQQFLEWEEENDNLPR